MSVIQDFKTILLVDEDDNTREQLTTILDRLGYGVESFDSSVAAIERLEEENGIDLVITDIKLSHMSGRTLARRVRGSYPVLMMSDKKDEIERARIARLFIFDKSGLSDPSELIDQIHAVNETFNYQRTIFKTEKNLEEFKTETNHTLTMNSEALNEILDIVKSGPKLDCNYEPGSAMWMDTFLGNLKKNQMWLIILSLIMFIGGGSYFNMKSVTKPVKPKAKVSTTIPAQPITNINIHAQKK